MNQGTPDSRLLVQMLAWIDARPRNYLDSMEAWRSSCPRHPVWDDALLDDLTRIDATEKAGMGAAPVVLTEAGRAMLDANRTDRRIAAGV
jgi:hypothetical protein